MMTMLRRQGMSAQVIWAGWVSRRRISACSCRWHRRMPQSLPRNCRTPRRPPKRHDEPDGPYPAGYYAGVDPGNMLQGFANISSAMDIIKKKGRMLRKPSVRFSSWPIRRGWPESQRVMPTVKFSGHAGCQNIKGVNDELKAKVSSLIFPTEKADLAARKRCTRS